VDVNVDVTERNTGTLNFGLGYSAAEKLTVQASVSQANIIGTGNMVAFQINSGSVNKVYSFSYLNPYWTADGISRGFDFFRRDVDTSSLSDRVVPHVFDRPGHALRHPGERVRHGEPGLHGRAHQARRRSQRPQRYQDFITEFGETVQHLPRATPRSRATAATASRGPTRAG
jgi:outer membrane protein insertion porin family